MIRVRVGEREIPLALTLNAMEALERRFGAPLDLMGVINGLKGVSTLLDVVAVLTDEGQDIEGTPDPVDRRWIARHADAAGQVDLANAVVAAVNESMRMETEADADPDEEVDVVLEELKKKEPTGG